MHEKLVGRVIIMPILQISFFFDTELPKYAFLPSTQTARFYRVHYSRGCGIRRGEGGVGWKAVVALMGNTLMFSRSILCACSNCVTQTPNMVMHKRFYNFYRVQCPITRTGLEKGYILLQHCVQSHCSYK